MNKSAGKGRKKLFLNSRRDMKCYFKHFLFIFKNRNDRNEIFHPFSFKFSLKNR